MSIDDTLPAGFEALQPIVAKWALALQSQREEARLSSTPEELRYVYDLMMPLIRDMMTAVDRFPIGQLPPDYGRLFSLALTLAEIAPNVELYKAEVRVTEDFDERRFVAAHGNHPNWTGLHSR